MVYFVQMSTGGRVARILSTASLGHQSLDRKVAPLFDRTKLRFKPTRVLATALLLDEEQRCWDARDRHEAKVALNPSPTHNSGAAKFQN